MMFSFRSRKSSSSSWPLALAHPPKPKPKPKHQCMPPVGICALVALSLGCLPAIINVYLHNKTLHALDNRVKPVQTFIPIPTQDESKERTLKEPSTSKRNNDGPDIVEKLSSTRVL
eukprot:scaffold13197_cov100-Skeletonema_dohrnii-CCMP3373.AAC.1